MTAIKNKTENGTSDESKKIEKRKRSHEETIIIDGKEELENIENENQRQIKKNEPELGKYVLLNILLLSN